MIPIEVYHKGICDYVPTWHAMRDYTDSRNEDSVDQVWVLQHPPVFTQGLNGKAEHILNAGDIPVVQIDRGGQVTYHGPGQVVIYPLLDLKRRDMGIRTLVTCLEQVMVDLLRHYKIDAISDPKAPGVYVGGAKIGSVGLRIRKGCCYHGLSFNVDMDLSPFSRINPCGMANLAVTQFSDLVADSSYELIESQLITHLLEALHETQPA